MTERPSQDSQKVESPKSTKANDPSPEAPPTSLLGKVREALGKKLKRKPKEDPNIYPLY